IGAGPRAVGSISITHLAVEPSAITLPAKGETITVTYSFLAEQAFDNAVAQVWRRCTSLICSREGMAPTTHNVKAAPSTISGVWTVKHSTNLGEYDLYIKAWLNCQGAAPDKYGGCGDEGAWATGYAGPVRVAQ